MIYINLIPVRDIKRRRKAKKEILFSAGLLVCLLLILGLWAGYQSNAIANITDTNNKLQEEKNKYSKVLEEIKKLEQEKKDLLARIEVINKLKESSSLTVRVLDEVARFTPSDRMWLKTFSQSASTLSLTGMALDDQTVARYMEDLEKSPFVNNVALVSSAMENFAERQLKTFSISCTVGFEKLEKTVENKK